MVTRYVSKIFFAKCLLKVSVTFDVSQTVISKGETDKTEIWCMSVFCLIKKNKTDKKTKKVFE